MTCVKIGSRLTCSQLQRVSPSLKWYFNPPACPHMGGAWERLVRSVKHAFYAMDLQRKMHDPLLYSLNDEALTPNHFLKGDISGGHPIGQFRDDVKILK